MKWIKKVLKYVVIGTLVYLAICSITPFSRVLKKRSIKHQIAYLDEILGKGYDNTLQLRFPEGKLFSNAIFSLSVIEYCDKNKLTAKKYAEIVDRSIKRILSKEAMNNFDPAIQPEYGIFYNGWVNYVLKKYKKSGLLANSSIKPRIENAGTEIESRIINTQIDSLRILNSYMGSSWPADNLLGLLSISNDTIQQAWLDLIFKEAKHPTGLINHSGSRNTLVRGSSQAMITFCLSELNYPKVEDYNQRFKDLLVKTYLGVQMVKEHEDGTNRMDPDSGPVVFGFGASATIMNIKTQASLNDNKSKQTWALMNSISCPINIFGKKYYLFKKEPMFDIFMLWACVELD